MLRGAFTGVRGYARVSRVTTSEPIDGTFHGHPAVLSQRDLLTVSNAYQKSVIRHPTAPKLG